MHADGWPDSDWTAEEIAAAKAKLAEFRFILRRVESADAATPGARLRAALRARRDYRHMRLVEGGERQ